MGLDVRSGGSWNVGGSTKTVLSQLVTAMTLLLAAVGMSAAPAHADSARIDHIDAITDRWLRVYVDSPAMGRIVEVQVLVPSHRDHPRPTVYLLDGKAADPVGSTWITRGDALSFFADKDVNVVLSVGGPVSYYTDWQRPDPVLGSYRWETFLTRELPPLLDDAFEGSGRNAIAGISMGAQAALMLAVRSPHLYAAVAGYSGCYSATAGFGQAQMRAVIASMGGDATNMFGAPEDPDWDAHDVFAHVDALRGSTVYLSAGSGLPGARESGSPMELADAALIGGPLEAVTGMCTRQLAEKLASEDIPATVDLRGTGTHSWPYWAAELRRSWPILDAALTEPDSAS